MATIFTRIVRGEIPSYKVAEDVFAKIEAEFDAGCCDDSHAADTINKLWKDENYLFDLDDRTLADMIVFAKRIARKLKEKIECKRVAVVVLGLEVPHAHIHLIPIQDEKDVDFHKEKLKLSPEEFRAIADTISL